MTVSCIVHFDIADVPVNNRLAASGQLNSDDQDFMFKTTEINCYT